MLCCQNSKSINENPGAHPAVFTKNLNTSGISSNGFPLIRALVISEKRNIKVRIIKCERVGSHSGDREIQ